MNRGRGQRSEFIYDLVLFQYCSFHKSQSGSIIILVFVFFGIVFDQYILFLTKGFILLFMNYVTVITILSNYYHIDYHINDMVSSEAMYKPGDDEDEKSGPGKDRSQGEKTNSFSGL